MTEINQIRVGDTTYDINLPSGVSVSVAEITAGSLTDTKVKSAKVLGTSNTGKLEAHSLGISDISNLQGTLNGKAAASHTHTKAEITSALGLGKVNDATG